MKIIRAISGMKLERSQMGGLLGFVPTMGYLHGGHMSLIRQARKENNSTVVSIFVNPSQFGPAEDFTAYPRNEKQDLDRLAEAGVDVAFLPSASDIYPPGYSTWITVEGLTGKLEGKSRPDHFRGVATICNKLFEIVSPDNVYMGQKDAQQVLVVRKMTMDLNMNLTVKVAPTVREADGLAMSSRNIYLNPAERQAAVVLYRALQLARELWLNQQYNPGYVIQALTEFIQREPLARIEYISINDALTLDEMDVINAPALVSMAVRIGATRLIDNIILE